MMNVGEIFEKENLLWQVEDSEYLPDSDCEAETFSSAEESETESEEEEYGESSNEEETTNKSRRTLRHTTRKRPHQNGLAVVPFHSPKKARHSHKSETKYKWKKYFSGRNIQPFVEQKKIHNRKAKTKILTPLDCFIQFFDSEVIRFIIDMTNLNAVRKLQGEKTASLITPQSLKNPFVSIKQEFVATNVDEKSWKFIDVNEMRAFLGLTILMGIIRLPNAEMYWQKKNWIFDVPCFNKIMPRSRFLKIFEHLHFCDESLALTVDDPQEDKLFKIRGLLTLLLSRFQACYTPGKNIHIDGTFIPFKGKIGFRRRNNSEKAPKGIKLWVVADSSTGYISRIQFYTGKDPTVNLEKGLSLRVVEYLMRPFEGLNHNLYLDNFFTSPEVFEYLLSKGIYACGTFNSDCVRFPKDLIMKQTCKMGESDWRAAGNLLAHSWMDNEAFYFLSTIHKPDYEKDNVERTTVKRRRGHKIYGSIERPCPPVVKDYHMHIMSAYLPDEVQKHGNITLRSKIWYKKIFSYLIEVAINNAKVVCANATGKKVDDLDFKKKLLTSLIGNHRAPQSSDAEYLLRLEDTGSHLPVIADRQLACPVCLRKSQRDKTSYGRKGKLSHVQKYKLSYVPRSYVRCNECDVHLCVRPTRNCYRDWHTKVEYWKGK